MKNKNQKRIPREHDPACDNCFVDDHAKNSNLCKIKYSTDHPEYILTEIPTDCPFRKQIV